MRLNKSVRRLPFRIDRQADRTLTEQVADGLRQAILMGRFNPGDILPPKLEMAAELGVNDITIRRALARLKDEGFIAPRPRRGILVCDSRRHSWRGHVLFASWSGADMYYHTVMAAEITRRLHAARYLVTDLYLDGAAHASEYAELRGILETRSVDLVLLEGGGTIQFEGQGSGVRDVLKRYRAPFLHVDTISAISRTDAAPHIILSRTSAYRALAAHCRMCGVREALLIVTWPAGSRSRRRPRELTEAFRKAGISCEWLDVRPVEGLRNPESVERGSLRAMRDWLASTSRFPDLIYFDDDFVARGALLALTQRGIRIPEDVQVATWANKGLGPVFDKPLTRIEMDPVAHGAAVAEHVLTRLENRNSSHAIELTPEFVVGETTRLREAAMRGSPTARPWVRRRAGQAGTGNGKDRSVVLMQREEGMGSQANMKRRSADETIL